MKKENILNNIALMLLALTYYAYVGRRIFSLDRYYITNVHSTCFRVVLLLGLLVVIIMKYNNTRNSKIAFLSSISIILFVLILSIHKEKSSLPDWIMNFDIFAYVMVIIACKDINYRTIIKVLLILYLIMNSLSLLLFPLISKTRNDIIVRAGFNIRYQLGRYMGSEVALIYYYIVLFYCYVRNTKIGFCEKILLIVTSFVMLYLTNTRYPFILSIIFMALMFNISNIRKIILSKYFAVLIAIIIVFVPVILLIVTINFEEGNQLYIIFNSLLSGRIRLVERAFYEYGIRVFGNEIIYSMIDYNVIDPSFFVILFEYGVLFYIIFIIALLYFLYLIYKNKDDVLMLVFAFSIFDMIFNVTISYFQYNLLLFFLSYKNTMCTRQHRISEA